MAQQRVQFYRGLESNYISQNQVVGNGADVAFKSKYINGVYFAKDTGVIYVNGKRYGFCNSLDVDAFTDVVYTYPKKDTNPKLEFKNSDGEVVKSVNMFRIYSGTPAMLSVDVDENQNYKISLSLKGAIAADKVKEADNALVANDDGEIGVFLGIERDEEKKVLNFVTYDAEGNARKFGSVNEGDYLKNTYLKEVKTETVQKDDKDVKVLRFIWNDDLTNSGLENTIIDIPIENIVGEYVSTINSYTINGKPISENPVLTGDDMIVGEIAENEWLPDAEGNYHYEYSVTDTIALALKKIDARITAKDNDIQVIDGRVTALQENVQNLTTDINNLKLISNVEVKGEAAGDFVSSVTNNDETNVITVTKGTIVNANLLGYETEQGVLNASYTISDALQNLDESLAWNRLEETEEKSEQTTT